MTHVLFVGDVRPFTRSEQRLRALREHVDRVTVVPTVPDDGRAPGVRRPGLLARVAHRIGRPLDLAGASRATRAALADGDVDLLWVEKALALDPRVVAAAPVPRVFVSEDDMARPHNQSRAFRRALPAYDLVCTTKPRNVERGELAALGARAVRPIPKCFDPALHRPVELSADERRTFGSDVAFVGTWEAERAAALSHLADAGLDVRVWGNGWRGRAPSARLRVEGRPAFGEDYARVLSAAAVQLCFLRRANDDRSTGRSVEIPAAGAFLLAERTDEHESLFEEGVEAEFFGDVAELLAKARAALDDPARRAAVARAGRARVLADDRSHGACVRGILDALEVPA